VHHAVAQWAGDEGVLGSGDRAQQQGPRLQAAQVVPVALLFGVHREQVQGARRDQPQHLRAFQVEAAEARAVDPRAHLPQCGDDDVALGYGRHLNAP
jgi:hypothetical protein